ncbi:glycosyltransferase family 39 protein [Mycobacterium sp. GA-2829]|uniref:glycosyltransferase family 39 protein n=1 Tax=Mycobacterium sp. GA-2829 TaxID=1772283 RepID=UPI00073FBEA1|nr:glycosyltransferase family 39 protein [Mycobacterium sp. GA-2829]KUI33270.1 glycosyl transferase [Mycobacterium sp. GA-2829]
MTLVLPADQTQIRAIDAPNARISVWSHRLAFGVLLTATAVLYLWNLAASGWANAFYSAAAQAGAQNWTAMLFGSSDAANGITVDKTPAALWVIDVSVRLFGLNSWSILVPQALMGVAAVAVLYAAVRRVSGPGAALLAGAVLASTPVAALMFRFNNPDALLVLLLVVAGYCVTRATERDAGRWWLLAAGVAVGFGFLAKMMQALLVLPGFAVAYLVAGAGSVRRRLAALLGAAAALVIAGGWYLVLAELWPADSRPYIGGSQHNSIVELALGYNGIGRLTGNEVGGLGNLDHDVGPGRLFGFGMGLDIAWLLPAALICLAAGVALTWRAPRTDVRRAALLHWGGWLLVTAVVFSFAGGIVHSYYTVALAPAVGAVVGIGAHLLWQNRFRPWCAVALAGGVLVTTVLAAVLLSRNVDWQPWLRAAVAVGGVGAAVLLVVVGRLPDRVARAVAGLAVVACLASPAAYAAATAATPHTGAIPGVGPGGGFGGGPPGLLSSPEAGAQLSAALARDAQDYRWAAAVVGSNNAAGYQLSSGATILALGGFNGTDPSPTLEQFQRYVADGEVHYFIGGRSHLGFGRAPQSGSRAATDIAEWVQAHYRAQTIDGVTVYDLTEGRA